MTFPIDKISYPDNNRCPMCRKKFSNKFLVMNLCSFSENGAVNDTGQISWTLGEHDHNAEKHRSVQMVDIETTGQSDIMVCSPKCLRAFFTKIVDKFEGK